VGIEKQMEEKKLLDLALSDERKGMVTEFPMLLVNVANEVGIHLLYRILDETKCEHVYVTVDVESPDSALIHYLKSLNIWSQFKNSWSRVKVISLFPQRKKLGLDLPKIQTAINHVHTIINCTQLPLMCTIDAESDEFVKCYSWQVALCVRVMDIFYKAQIFVTLSSTYTFVKHKGNSIVTENVQLNQADQYLRQQEYNGLYLQYVSEKMLQDYVDIFAAAKSRKQFMDNYWLEDWRLAYERVKAPAVTIIRHGLPCATHKYPEPMWAASLDTHIHQYLHHLATNRIRAVKTKTKLRHHVDLLPIDVLTSGILQTLPEAKNVQAINITSAIDGSALQLIDVVCGLTAEMRALVEPWLKDVTELDDAVFYFHEGAKSFRWHLFWNSCCCGSTDVIRSFHEKFKFLNEHGVTVIPSMRFQVDWDVYFRKLAKKLLELEQECNGSVVVCQRTLQLLL
jgi:hypothetical protein